jgi:hypothetical protein
MTPTEPKIILYVHPATISYYDYRELLERSVGVMFSATGDSWDAYGFEADITPAEFIDRVFAKLNDPQCYTRIAIGPAIERRSNINPHGLI